ncbi:hypothetical protein GN956_G13176 [Arapaima gigas]
MCAAVRSLQALHPNALLSGHECETKHLTQPAVPRCDTSSLTVLLRLGAVADLQQQCVSMKRSSCGITLSTQSPPREAAQALWC